jgi:hypothetical protein
MADPAQNRVEGQLAAILTADGAGYRCLMDAKEAGAARTARSAGVQG